MGLPLQVGLFVRQGVDFQLQVVSFKLRFLQALLLSLDLELGDCQMLLGAATLTPLDVIVAGGSHSFVELILEQGIGLDELGLAVLLQNGFSVVIYSWL